MHVVITEPSLKKIRARKLDILRIYSKNYEMSKFWWRHYKILKKNKDPKLNLEIWIYDSKIWMLKNNISKKKKILSLNFCALKTRKSLGFTMKFGMGNILVDGGWKMWILEIFNQFFEKFKSCSLRWYDQIISNHNTCFAIKHRNVVNFKVFESLKIKISHESP